jgi:uncharacterized protein DUF6399
MGSGIFQRQRGGVESSMILAPAFEVSGCGPVFSHLASQSTQQQRVVAKGAEEWQQLLSCAAPRANNEGAPQRLRTPLFEPSGALGTLSPMAQSQLKDKAKTRAEVFQRSSSNVEGRNGYLSLRNHQLRGLDHPRKRACLTAIHNFFLTRPDGTTAAERFFGQKPRSMFAAILDAVDVPPVPLSPPKRAVA